MAAARACFAPDVAAGLAALRPRWCGVSRASPASRSAARASTSARAGSGRPIEVITFDLDDTLWPTTPVVMAANEAFVEFCQARIPGFPDCAGVNEYMKTVRLERIEAAERANERHFPLSFASLRIAGGFRAAVDAGYPEADAIGVVSRGYHIAWIPTRGSAAQKHLFPGVVEALARIRANHPDALVGSITNGLGSAAGAGLGASEPAVRPPVTRNIHSAGSISPLLSIMRQHNRKANNSLSFSNSDLHGAKAGLGCHDGRKRPVAVTWQCDDKRDAACFQDRPHPTRCSPAHVAI